METGMIIDPEESCCASAEDERERLKDALLRARADFLNYQARAQNDLRRAEESALRGYVLDLLPILDALDLAAHNSANWTEELEAVRASLEQTLQVHGLKRIGSALGKPFDLATQEAIASHPADAAKGEQPGQVVAETRAGYLWKGVVLRPTQVLVAI
jgi:molecular chaperone GrpE (heat shock protein)